MAPVVIAAVPRTAAAATARIVLRIVKLLGFQTFA
jgi:hypothetical protein